MLEKNREISVFGVGSPLMDIIAHVEHSFLQRFAVIPNTMNLIAENIFKEIFAQLKEYTFMPGGSCTNTLKGFAFLAAGDKFPSPLFIGTVGKDQIGSQYIQAIEALGIKSGIRRKNTPTGTSLILVTPDSERTMLTCLGAGRKITAADVDFALVSQAKIFHLTGYEWDTLNQKKIAKKLAEIARAHNVLVSFDLADPFVVSRYKDEFISWIPEYVDILFGNREEYTLLVGSDKGDEDIIAAAGNMAKILVMKVGRNGAYCYSQQQLFHSAGYAVKAIDTTGAGDAFAGAFIYGLLKQLSLPLCLKLANKFASLIVAIVGCNYDCIDRREIQEIME